MFSSFYISFFLVWETVVFGALLPFCDHMVILLRLKSWHECSVIVWYAGKQQSCNNAPYGGIGQRFPGSVSSFTTSVMCSVERGYCSVEELESVWISREQVFVTLIRTCLYSGIYFISAVEAQVFIITFYWVILYSHT